MDSNSRFNSVYLVPDSSVVSATVAFETTWIVHFWPPLAVQGGQNFDNSEFMAFLNTYGTKIRPVPARKHKKNRLQPKNVFIRSIFIYVKEACLNVSISLLDLSAVTISNDLYRSDEMS